MVMQAEQVAKKYLTFALNAISMEMNNEETLLEALRNPQTMRQGFAGVVVKAWTNLENFRGDAKLTTWLYRIAINESITFLNKKRNQNNISIDEDDSFLINQLESDDYFDGDEAALQLQKAILTLPEKQRLVFQMKYFDEMKYDEMSEILGTSVGALKASYHHAVKKIEKFLGEED